MNIRHAALAFLLVGACRPAAERKTAVSSADGAWVQDSSCAFERQVSHPDAAQLAAEFLARDAAGDFLKSDSWFDGATTCPGHEPGPDTHGVVAAYRMRPLLKTDTLVVYAVDYANLGSMHYEQVPPANRYHAVWDVHIGNIEDTLAVVHTSYGWRVRSPALWQNVLADTLFSRAAATLDPADAQRMHAVVDSMRQHGWGGGA